MGTEIEKKFLIINDDWRSLGTGESYCQGYLNSEKGRTVRVRTINDRWYFDHQRPKCWWDQA